MKKCMCPTCGHKHEAMRKATTDEQQERAAREGLKGAKEAARALAEDAVHEAGELRGKRMEKAYTPKERAEVRRKKEHEYGGKGETFAVPGTDSYPLTKDGKPSEERTMAAWRYICTEKDESKLSKDEAETAKRRIKAFAKKHFGKELQEGEETKKALPADAAETPTLPTDEVYALQDRALWPLTKAMQPDATLIRGAWRAVHSRAAQVHLRNEEAAVAEFRIRHFAEHHRIDLSA